MSITKVTVTTYEFETDSEAVDQPDVATAVVYDQAAQPSLTDFYYEDKLYYGQDILRKGEVIGMQEGRYGQVNVEVLEHFNERDGWHVEPKYKLFSANQIKYPTREREGEVYA